MKLYGGGRAPDPRRTRIFLAEKGLKLPTEQVDLGALEQILPDQLSHVRRWHAELNARPSASA